LASFSFKKSFRVISCPLKLLFAERSPAFGALSIALTEPSLLIDLLPVLELLSLVLDEILFSLLFYMELVVITI